MTVILVWFLTIPYLSILQKIKWNTFNWYTYCLFHTKKRSLILSYGPELTQNCWFSSTQIRTLFIKGPKHFFKVNSWSPSLVPKKRQFWLTFIFTQDLINSSIRPHTSLQTAYFQFPYIKHGVPIVLIESRKTFVVLIISQICQG